MILENRIARDKYSNLNIILSEIMNVEPDIINAFNQGFCGLGCSNSTNDYILAYRLGCKFLTAIKFQ